MEKQLFNVQMMPKGVQNPLFEQRESGIAHTPYEVEVAFYDCIRRGDVDGVKKGISMLFSNALVVGRMSNDNLRQAQYLAVSCITLATRVAIEGGLEQSVAYNLSDKYIQHIDSLKTQEEIFAYLCEKAVDMTILIDKHRNRANYPPYVKRAMRYIKSHLHEKLQVQDVADEIGVSADYLSLQFKKSTGMTLSKYIMREKLEESKTLLDGSVDYSEIGYYLGFCSETHYINSFKKEYGMTPRQYLNAKVQL